MGENAAVVAEELIKVFPNGVRAVNGISLEVEAGEAFGLLGPNGAGKTTTIGMLTTSVLPTSGRAFLGGIDVGRDPVTARAISSVVFQDPVVDRPLTGRRNLETHTRLWGVRRQDASDKIADLAETAGISAILDRPVATYSGGERRRLEIVRALSSDPRVLFLDEPTVGLDTRIRHDLFDVIATLRDRIGVTIILTTHYLDEAESLCDRLAIIDGGTVVACDSPSALLASMGREVLELRLDHPAEAIGTLLDRRIRAEDVFVIGSTMVIALRGLDPAVIVSSLDDAGYPVRTSTTRAPSLDDVYLRLTGARIETTNN